ncbi:hypothetical protein LOC70_00125 [Rhodopirellula sp. JC737]|nr:hypothetical protein [Rhodopirellula sp. JC737]
MNRNIKRREAVGTIITGGVGGLAGMLANRQANASDQSKTVTDVFCSELTLAPDPTADRPTENQLRKFVPTQVRSGHVFCTLTSQNSSNPAIVSVYAAPAEQRGQLGAEITINFLGQPSREVQLSLLHVGNSA